MKNSFRVGFMKDLPNNAPIYTYAEDITECKRILKQLHNKGKFQSEQFPIPGLSNIAVIEYWDEAECDWLSWIED